jgi:lipopolysaccharide export system protein LptA
MGANLLQQAKLLPALLLALSATVQALPEDRDQAIEIRAQQAMRDDPQGLTVYQGNVTIVQGTIQIRADKVSVYNTDKKVSRIVCVGQPAQLQQQTKANESPVIAKGKTVEYDLVSDQIYLTGDASLTQDDSILTGQRIEYDLTKEIIRANGGKDGNERIRMVIPPSQQQGAY